MLLKLYVLRLQLSKSCKLVDSIRLHWYFEVALDRGMEVMVDRIIALTTFRIYEGRPLGNASFTCYRLRRLLPSV